MRSSICAVAHVCGLWVWCYSPGWVQCEHGNGMSAGGGTAVLMQMHLFAGNLQRQRRGACRAQRGPGRGPTEREKKSVISDCPTVDSPRDGSTPSTVRQLRSWGEVARRARASRGTQDKISFWGRSLKRTTCCSGWCGKVSLGKVA